jgi:catalase
VQIPRQDAAGHQDEDRRRIAHPIGVDREPHPRDRLQIARGEYSKWTVKVQIMTEEQAANFQWNPFDLTKVWSHRDYPLMEIDNPQPAVV